MTTANQWIVLEIELLTTVGWKCCQPPACPCSQNVIAIHAKKRCTLYACFDYIRNLSLHSLPVDWCSWEQVFYSLPPPAHHGDSFAAEKELPSPLLSPRIIFAHRIQSTAGRIWPLIERFDRCPAVPCDSALIRWRSIAVVPSKIQDFAEFDRFHLFVKVPDSCTRIKHHLQAEGNECRKVTSDEKQLSLSIFQCDSSEIVVVIVSFLVAPALETQRFTRTNIPVCFCRVVWMLWCGRLCLFEVNWTFYLCQCGFLGLFHVTKKRSWGVRSHFKRRGCRKRKQCHSAFGMPELASEACGVLGAGLSKERM